MRGMITIGINGGKATVLCNKCGNVVEEKLKAFRNGRIGTMGWQSKEGTGIMADRFFTQTRCDRCGGSLDGGRIMSMYNEDVLCMTCKEKERQRPDYREAVEADNAAIRRGVRNFKGIGLKKK